MSHVADALEEARAEFETFLAKLIPLGAVLWECDEILQPVPPAHPYYAPAAQVRAAVHRPDGEVFYRVEFGPLTLEAHDEPGGVTRTFSFTDPAEEIRPGQYAFEVLTGDGAPSEPRQFIVLDTDLTPADAARMERR